MTTETTAGADKFVEMTKGIRTCMMVTRGLDGSFNGRPMAVQTVDKDGTVWFMSFADVAKVDEINADNRVQLTYADGDTWVSAQGTATASDDVAKKQELWNPFAEAWFQTKPEDPNVVVIRVDVTGGEYWDSPSKPAQLFGVVKALITKTEPSEGDSGTFKA